MERWFSSWGRHLAKRAGTRHALAFLAPIPVIYLVYAGIWVGQHRLEADFTAFYTGALMAARGMGAHLFDLDLQRQVQGEIIYPHHFEVGGVLPFRNPPFAVLPLLPLASLPIEVAYYLWAVLNLGFLVGALLLLSAATPRLRAHRGFRGLLWLASFAFLPTLSALLLGQMSFLLLFTFVAGFELLRRRRDMAGGVLLSVVAMKPQLLLVLPLVLLAKGRWRALAGLATGVLGLFGLSLVLVGPFDTVQFLEASRETAGWLPLNLDLTWSGLASELLSPWPSAVLAATLSLDAISLGLLWLAWRGPYRPEGSLFPLQLALLLLTSMVVAPHLYAHDLVLLIPVAFYFAGYALQEWKPGSRSRGIAKATGAAVFVLALVDSYRLLPLPVRPVFLGMVMIGWALFMTIEAHRQHELPSPEGARRLPQA